MRRYVMILVSAVAMAARASAGDAPLVTPPATAAHWVIESTGGKHGDSWIWTASDGALMARESMILRGQVFELEMRGVAGADGMPVSVEIRGSTPNGDAGEGYSSQGAHAEWHSPVDKGSSDAAGGHFYATFGGPIGTGAWLAEATLRSPGHALPLLPGGQVGARKAASLVVHTDGGGGERTVELWLFSGLGNSPLPIWMNTDGTFFGVSVVLGWLPEAYAGEQAALEAAQTKAMSEEIRQLAHTLPKDPKSTTAFTHVRVFDAERLRFLEDRTVLVRGERIAAIGPAAKVKVPAGALRIDGRGHTLLPGLWDCHMHVGDDYTGVQELSIGVTSVRDPGNNDALTIDRRTRAAARDLLMPTVYPSSLIDGKGPNTAQVANVATSQAEAIAWVDKAKQNAFTGVKFYGTFDKAWLPAAIAEAHKLGLHVHGHIPQGMRPLEAVQDGYDEITHINWIIMQAMPDDVIDVSSGLARFEGPGRYGKDVDLDGAAMQSLLQAMAGKHIYSDPTMVAFESLYVPENGDLSPSYEPFTGTLPPTLERQFRAGGFAPPAGVTRADYRASWAKMVALLARMRTMGIPIVAGTDGNGIELVRELQVYQEAGYTPAQAIAAATLVPARLVGHEKDTGSITVGKLADLVLVKGDPSKRLADLRQTRWVMQGGRLFDADALRTAAGFAGRPH